MAMLSRVLWLWLHGRSSSLPTPYEHDATIQRSANERPTVQGPQFKGPLYKGPMFKGPMFKGPPINAAVKANPWNQAKGPPTGGFNYQMRHFEPQSSSFYPETSFEPYSPEPEPQPEPMPDHQEPHNTEHDQEHEHEHEHEPNHRPEEHILEEIPPPSSGGEHPEGETTGVY